MDQTQSEFLLQIEELLDRTYTDLDALRDVGLDGRQRRELLERLFRNVHSVKGSAASCGLLTVNELAHEFESLLDAARAGRIVLDDATLDICNDATDALSANLEQSVSGVASTPQNQLIEKLQRMAMGAFNSGNADSVISRAPVEVWEKLTEAERYRLASAIREANSLYFVSARFDTARFDEEFFDLKEKLAEWGEAISTSPSVDDLHPNKINFQILFASTIEASQLIENLTVFPSVALTPVELSARGEFQSTSGGTSSSISAMSNFIRADLDTLDRLISSTHKLFRTTSAALELATAQPQNRQLEKLQQEIKDSFLRVEQELIGLRMVSLAPTLQRAARAGKAAARSAGKEIDFRVTGDELRIDKLLADTIADPLIQLCRNAVDHGIDHTEKRVASGKTARGSIRIEALDDGGRLRLRVTDDGRGIDPKVISEAAKRLGISDTQGGLDFERSLRLIFRPGFTTAEKASDLSGRGVGLDIVETAVEQAGGELRVSSKPGVGTTFEIRLPVTFGLIDATVVVAGGNRYCIAASQTTEQSLVDGKETSSNPQYSLQELVGLSSVRQTGSLPPAAVKQTVSLRPASSKTTQEDASAQRRVLTFQLSSDGLNNQENRVAILVDDIEGTEKVLVRTLGRHAGRWYGVAGATELSDGSIALVLNLRDYSAAKADFPYFIFHFSFVIGGIFRASTPELLYTVVQRFNTRFLTGREGGFIPAQLTPLRTGSHRLNEPAKLAAE